MSLVSVGTDLVDAPPFKPRVAATKDDSLAPSVAFDEHHLIRQERPVVLARFGIQQMNAGQIALAASDRLQSRGAADRDQLRRYAPLLELARAGKSNPTQWLPITTRSAIARPRPIGRTWTC